MGTREGPAGQDWLSPEPGPDQKFSSLPGMGAQFPCHQVGLKLHLGPGAASLPGQLFGASGKI